MFSQHSSSTEIPPPPPPFPKLQVFSKIGFRRKVTNYSNLRAKYGQDGGKEQSLFSIFLPSSDIVVSTQFGVVKETQSREQLLSAHLRAKKDFQQNNLPGNYQQQQQLQFYPFIQPGFSGKSTTQTPVWSHSSSSSDVSPACTHPKIYTDLCLLTHFKL